MEYWIQDLAEMSEYSLSTLKNWLRKGFLEGFLEKHRMMVKLNSDNLFKVRRELERVDELAKSKKKEFDMEKIMRTAKYRTLENFADLWRFNFDKKNFTLNGYKVEYRRYRLGDKKRFDGKRYFIKNIDVQADFYSENSKLKKLLKYEVQEWQR